MLSDEACHGASHSPASRSEGTQGPPWPKASRSALELLGSFSMDNLSWVVWEVQVLGASAPALCPLCQRLCRLGLSFSHPQLPYKSRKTMGTSFLAGGCMCLCTCAQACLYMCVCASVSVCSHTVWKEGRRATLES